ncbi:MAG TPA: aminoacetone oxidase family FAD-binding enzyme, partial [Armatimonadetes bacterium]|nr:aminoacetone oxidase family FAD-binding enzyme [Armatimonadota bacterium]
NLKPAVSVEDLDARLVSDFVQPRLFKNYLPELLPRIMIPVFLELSGIPADESLNKIRAKDRKRIIELLTNFRLTVKRARSADEAIVTAGGGSIK